MALNIKNETTCKLARELADLTDDTITGAVTIALQERIVTVRREREALLRDIREIAERCSENLRSGPSYEEIIESMYGEFGEPI